MYTLGGKEADPVPSEIGAHMLLIFLSYTPLILKYLAKMISLLTNILEQIENTSHDQSSQRAAISDSLY